jgi:hypothetical protein
MLDVDEELWQVLDMCSDEELELVYNILHSSSPFSPVRYTNVRLLKVHPYFNTK